MIRTVAETGSTNDDVAALAREGAPGRHSGFAPSGRPAARAGRAGRGSRRPAISTLRPWSASSPAIRPRRHWPWSPRSRCTRWCDRHAPAARIKWPNDLLVGGAKLAGILLERQGDAVIVGFGVNLAHHPEDLDRPATSLEARPSRPDAFLERLAAVFQAWLGRWRAEGFAPIRAAWLAAAHPIGTALTTSDARGTFEGLDEIRGIAAAA